MARPHRVRLGLPGPPVVLALVIAAGIAGFAAGAALKITNNGTIRGIGEYVSTSGISTWWTAGEVESTTIPATVPGAVSTTVGTPTVLPASNANYTLNAATAGSKAILWEFVENTTAPPSTELELNVNISVGPSATVSIVAFVETQSSAPVANLTFQFYYQTGVVTLTKTVIQSFTEVSQQCTSIGVCP